MFNSIFTFFTFIILSINFSYSQEKIEKILPIFEMYIEKSMKEWEAPGLAIGIVKDGKIVYQKAFGTKEINKNQPVDEHTVFQIASLTKNFLVYLMAQLVDEGHFKWDDTVKKYVKDFFIGDSDTSEKFTIRDLISHRSGLKGFSGDTFWTSNFSPAEIQQAMAKLNLVTPLRQSYAYQNQLFGMASLIVEKIMNKSIEQLFKERLFDPLGMKDSSVGKEGIPYIKTDSLWSKIINFFNSKKDINFAYPHHILDNKVTVLTAIDRIYTFPGSTGINTSITDANKWMLFQLNNGVIDGKKIISDANQQELRTPHIDVTNLKPNDLQFPSSHVHNPQYGMGWFLYNYGQYDKQLKVIGHMGGFGGNRSLIALVPQENMGIIILSNFGSLRVSMLPEALRAKFLDLYLGLSDTDWSQKLLNQMKEIREKNKQMRDLYRLQHPAPSESLKKFCGTYKHDIYGDMQVNLKDDKLIVNYRDQIIPLNHWNGNEFSFKGNDLTPVYSDYDKGFIEFGLDKNQQKVCIINLLAEGKDDLFRKAD